MRCKPRRSHASGAPSTPPGDQYCRRLGIAACRARSAARTPSPRGFGKAPRASDPTTPEGGLRYATSPRGLASSSPREGPHEGLERVGGGLLAHPAGGRAASSTESDSRGPRCARRAPRISAAAAVDTPKRCSGVRLSPSADGAKVRHSVRRRRRARRQWGLRTFESWGFFRGPKGGAGVGDRDQALPRGRGRPRVGAGDARRDGRPEVLRPARHVAAHDAARPRVRRVRVRRGARVRRLVDPRLAGDLGVGHAAHAAGRDGRPRSRRRGADALARLRDRRPAHARAVRARPARRGAARRGVPALDGRRGHRVLRPRVRVLRLRRGALRARDEPGALLRRLVGGPLELRPPRPRLHGAPEGGLLPARRRTTRCTTCAPRWC